MKCLPLGVRERGHLKRLCEKYGEDVVLGWWDMYLRVPSKIGHSLAAFSSNHTISAYLARTGNGKYRDEREVEEVGL